MSSERELKVIFDSFNRLFNGRTLSLSTSYVRLEDFYIRFDTLQLSHLLGLHKIYHYPANVVYQKILAGEITLAKVKKNQHYGEIKDRIRNIDFLREGFIDTPFESCILVAKTDNQNSMRLDLVFKGNRNSRKLVIGLRRVDKELQPLVFAPVTFFVTKSKYFDYTHSKRIEIKDFKWLN